MNDLIRIAPMMAEAMTVKQVAEALSVSDRTVRRHAAELYPESVQDGKTTILSEIQVTEIKKAIERSGRNDLDNVVQVRNSVTDLEMLERGAEFVAWQASKIATMRAEMAILTPKAEFYDQVADAGECLHMRDIAALLNIPGWGRNNIFALLRQKKILDEKNIPLRGYQERGYFRVIEQKFERDGKTHIDLRTLVTQKGLDYIRKIVNEASSEAKAQA
jgi:phage antirepressor YoqD-like protein